MKNENYYVKMHTILSAFTDTENNLFADPGEVILKSSVADQKQSILSKQESLVCQMLSWQTEKLLQEKFLPCHAFIACHCAIYTLSCRSSLIQAPQAGEPGKKELQSEVKVLLIFSIKFFPEHFCCSSERCTVCGMLIIMTGRKLVAGAEGSLLFGPDFKSPHSVPTL